MKKIKPYTRKKANIIIKAFQIQCSSPHQDAEELGLTEASVLHSDSCLVGLSVIGKEA